MSQPDTQRTSTTMLLLSDLITATIDDNNYKAYLHTALQVTKHVDLPL